MPASTADSMTLREKIPTEVYDDSASASRTVARRIADLIRQRASAAKHAVLGLATGSTPTEVYAELIRMHREEGLSFRNVITFNLDEYYPMNPQELQSYRRFMQEHLFDHVDIPAEQTHVPDGTIAVENVQEHCRQYEKAIDDAGGMDVQLLGIGRTGHIGFNEPGSSRSSLTRLITLDKITRLDAASDFFGEQNVPRRAITMGVGTVFKARHALLLAFGEHKAPIIAQAVEGPITSSVAASYLQEHPQATVILDTAAAAELTRYKTPWLLGPVQWDDRSVRRAVIWTSQTHRKPILKLTEEDYNESGLQDLLAERGPAHDLNVGVFRQLQRTITGWPGGKPESAKRPGDATLPRDAIHPKRVIIFSPHPDDDVISMGGTLMRLVDQGHEVHVAYQTSGNIAVFDEDVIQFVDCVDECSKLFGIDHARTAKLYADVAQFLAHKQPGQVDSPHVQQIKGLIRRGEARTAGRYCGIPHGRLHFLDMPFYETGRVRKKPLSDADIQIVANLLETVQPHQIYAAGDLSDPHGTHRTCLTAIFNAIQQIRSQSWYQQCEVWLYRGAWQEWEPEKVDMAVPMSPQQLDRKRFAIFKHESQKDKALFPGTDQREFWQRAEDRNRMTAKLYDLLGLPEYEAIESFVWWPGSGAAPSRTAGVSHK